MTHLQETLKEFDEKIGTKIIKGKVIIDIDKYDDTVSFLIKSHLSYLQEEKKRLEGERVDNTENSLYEDMPESRNREVTEWHYKINEAFNSAIDSEIALKQEQIKEAESLIK
jgi:hypothetical protein